MSRRANRATRSGRIGLRKKARVNQLHRHRAGQALRVLERLGDLASIEGSPIEVTAEQLRKIDPREKLFKWGVMSLKDYVNHNQKAQQSRADRARRERERIYSRYKDLIEELERDAESPKSADFLREISRFDHHLYLFLKWNPEWKPRLKKKLSEIQKSSEKVRALREKKEAEKQRAKALIKAIQNLAKKPITETRA